MKGRDIKSEAFLLTEAVFERKSPRELLSGGLWIFRGRRGQYAWGLVLFENNPESFGHAIKRSSIDSQDFGSLTLVVFADLENVQEIALFDFVQARQAIEQVAMMKPHFAVHLCGQVVEGNDSSFRKLAETFNRVFELSDVAGPGILHQSIHCFLGDRHLRSLAVSVFLEKV
jgi:hypothetical protein